MSRKQCQPTASTDVVQERLMHSVKMRRRVACSVATRYFT